MLKLKGDSWKKEMEELSRDSCVCKLCLYTVGVLFPSLLPPFFLNNHKLGAHLSDGPSKPFHVKGTYFLFYAKRPANSKTSLLFSWAILQFSKGLQDSHFVGFHGSSEARIPDINTKFLQCWTRAYQKIGDEELMISEIPLSKSLLCWVTYQVKQVHVLVFSSVAVGICWRYSTFLFGNSLLNLTVLRNQKPSTLYLIQGCWTCFDFSEWRNKLEMTWGCLELKIHLEWVQLESVQHPSRKLGERNSE